MEELQAIRLGHLTQDGSFSFLNFTKKKLPLLPQDTSEPDLPDVQSVLRTLSLKSPRLQKAVDKFVEAVKAFDAALRMARKKPLTEQLSAADEDRDKAWMGSNTYINAMLNHPDAEVAAVAKIAREIFDKYGNPTRLSRKEESSSLHNLLQDIEAMESRSTIDFDPWYNWMKTTYEAFEALRSERADLKDRTKIGLAQETRTAAEDAYREMAKVLNSVVVYEETDEYDPFINAINNEIEETSALIKSRETRRGNEGSTTPDEKPSDDDKPSTDNPDNPSTEEPDTPATEQPGNNEEPDDRPVVQ